VGSEQSEGNQLVATVLPDLTGLDKSFDYLVPETMRERLRIGSMVRVPLNGRRTGGWVVALGATSSEVPTERLVPIAKWSGHGPSAEVIDLARWAALRWGVGRLRPFLVSASPASMVHAVPDVRRGSTIGTPVAESMQRLLAGGGGVVRIGPNDDALDVVRAAASRGRIIVAHPAHDAMMRMAARLRSDGLTVAVLPHDWALAAGGADVVIGGRSAVWATTPSVDAIVVIDEHDEALQEERSPTWHARDVAIERAARVGAPCLLVSPCPTVASLAWSGRRWVRPTIADQRASWPIVEVVDRSDEEPWKRSLLTSPLIAALRDHSRRVVCVHNTPGRARLLACRSCRSLLMCERCQAAVVQHDDGRLVCPRCATGRPPVCQHCGSGALANVRPGVSRLREELEAAAARPVAAVTGEGVAMPTDVSVHVGTEAVLHRVREADVVAFVDFDAELFAPRYRAAEQAFALLVRAARLLGPRSAGGRLIVQTFQPDHEVIQAALHADPGHLAAAEAARRRDLGLPPFGALARISGAGAAEFVIASGLTGAADRDGVLVRADSWEQLGPRLAATPRPKGSRLRVEVDPARR
jgi:primosomal protein N' (replication factor Y) (superfamily II helicase)